MTTPHTNAAAAPDQERLFQALDATWPPARIDSVPGWTLRLGAGGGQRVSAARGEGEIALAEEGMRAMGQTPLFCLDPGQEALDTALSDRGYTVTDRVYFFAGKADAIYDGADETAKVIRCSAPLRRVEEIWDRGGVTAPRRAIMERCACPKLALLARAGDRPAGCAFVACDGGVAMIHAIEVLPEYRKQGVGARLLRGAARFAQEEGAEWLTLAVTVENEAANALYRKLGMEIVAGYHYRKLSD